MVTVPTFPAIPRVISAFAALAAIRRIDHGHDVVLAECQIEVLDGHSEGRQTISRSVESSPGRP